MPLPHRIKYATVGSHSVSSTASASGALVTAGTSGSATPSGLVRLGTLTGTIASGSSLTAGANVTGIYLASDSDGRYPITDASVTTKLGLLVTTAIAGFALRIEQDVYISGSVYVVTKLASGDSGTATYTLTFREAV